MSSDPPPAPVTNNYEESMREALEAQIDLAPDLFKAESDPRYGRQAYARLNQDIVRESLLGREMEVDAEGYSNTFIEGKTPEDGFAIKTEEQKYTKYLEDNPDVARVIATGRDPNGSVAYWTKGKEPWEAAKDHYQSHGISEGRQVYDVGVYNKEGEKVEGAVEREFVGGEEGTRRSGGAVELLAGEQEFKFAGEDSARRAGFDANGNFLGTAQLEEDIRQRQKDRALTQEIQLAKDKGAELTDAIRGGADSNLSQAINEFSALSRKSSNPGNINNPIQGSLNEFITARAGVKDISGPAQTQEISADQQIDVNRVNSLNIGSQNIAAQNQKSYLVEDEMVGTQGIGDLGGLRSGLTGAAMSDLSLGGDLSDQERRSVEQDARAAAMARGRLRDTSSIVDEVAELESARRARRNERRQFAQSVAGQEAQLRESDVSRDLQAGLANQSTAMQARLANQQAQMQTSQANADRDMQAQLANQNAGLTAAQANQQANLQAGLANQSANLQADTTMAQLDLQAQGMNVDRINQESMLKMQAEQANQNKNMELMRQQIEARTKDIDRGIQVDQLNKQLDMQALAQDRAAMQNLIATEQATSADPFMAITGRPSGQTVTAGQSAYGTGAAGINAGPQLYNPAQGAEFMANQAAMLNSYNSAVYGANQAKWGGIIGGAATGLGMAIGCWVAREVYGQSNIKWIMFRHWLFSKGPSWFRLIYLSFGERFARFISDKPSLKKRIRAWMDSKIKEMY